MTTIRHTVEIPLDLDIAATWFANLSDDDIAQFFCKVAAKVNEWPPAKPGEYRLSPQMFWCEVGQHLATCECSTEAGRQMIRDIAYFMDKKLGVAA